MKLSKVSKKGAVTPKYVSPNQLTLVGFESPFEQQLTSENRWVKLSKLIPWDSIVGYYDNQFKSREGRPPINGRVVIGAVFIKHMLGLSDRETILQIQENMFLQYFLGYSSFTNEAPFSASLFVEIRERLTEEILSKINDLVVLHHFDKLAEINNSKCLSNDDVDKNDESNTHQPKIILQNESIENNTTENNNTTSSAATITHQGRLLMDATVAPQNITFPTDLKLLNASREKSEELIDKLYNKTIHQFDKPRTYREIARKDFLDVIKKKQKSTKAIYKANGSQLRYLRRNLGYINELLNTYHKHQIEIPLKPKDCRYIETLDQVYYQQHYMHSNNVHTIQDRIVSIHQPYVRTIARGKEGKKYEFGSKMQLCLVAGFAFMMKLSWDNFNEGTCLISSVESYKKKFGYYPLEVLADKIYSTRENRSWLKEKGIKLCAKPLGRPSAEASSNLVSPGERNPIEGKFGQAKVGYGLASISAKLKSTSESWISSIILVLNLVNLTRLYLLHLYQVVCFMLLYKNRRLSC